MDTKRETAWLGAGTILAAIAASVCCVLPIAVALLGVGSAALGAAFEPARPYLVVVTLALLGFAFYRAYRPAEGDCAPGEVCAVPASRRRQRAVLWVVALLALLLLTFPYYIGWIL